MQEFIVDRRSNKPLHWQDPVATCKAQLALSLMLTMACISNMSSLFRKCFHMPFTLLLTNKGCFLVKGFMNP